MNPETFNGMSRAMQNYVDRAADVVSMTNKVFSDTFQGMENAVASFVMTGKLSFKDLAKTIQSDLIHMALKILESKALQYIFSLLGPKLPLVGGIQNPMAMAAFAASGKAFDGNSREITAFARGGIVDRPTLFGFAGGTGLMGEAGPEAIIPLMRGGDGKLGVKAHGLSGGGANVNVSTTVVVQSNGQAKTSTHSDHAMGKHLGDLINAKIKEGIVRAMQPGGIIWKQRGGR